MGEGVLIKEGKIKLSDWKSYLTYIAIILFLMAGYIILGLIDTLLLKYMMEDSSKQVNVYTSRLSNSIYANNIINQLLEDRLVSACNMILENEDNLSNDFLIGVSKNLKVDHIYWYDYQGKIIYTANDYLNWQANIGDSIYDFMVSHMDILVEPIRKAADSGIYTKYAQMKGKKGFVQVGILAENIQEITNRFCPQVFVEELAEQENIEHVYYINNDNELLFCDDYKSYKDIEIGPDEKSAIEEDRIYYARKTLDDKDVYEAIYPIYADSKKMGTLIIIYSLDGLNVTKTKFSQISIILLIFIFLIYGVMAINTVKKNNKIRELAYFDPVTNIFNKNYFITCMNDTIKKDSKNKKAILIIKFRNLELLKLNYGQNIVDNLLVRKTSKLRKLKVVKNKGESLFRYSKDSLCIYIDNYEKKEDLIEISNNILNSLEKTTDNIENEELFSSKVIIFELNKNYKQIDRIINDIDIAIGRMDEVNDERYIFFDEKDRENIILNEKIEGELLKAHYTGYEEFYLLYQPQLDLQTNRIVGIEALVRWNSKLLGNIPPIQFINIAEKSKAINSLGKWVIMTACNFLKQLEDSSINDIMVAINISVIQLLHESFLDDISNIIMKTGVNPKLLKFEITETNLMDNYEVVNSKLELLKEKGIGISLDDFGTGHSSLARLKNLNIDYLKIDKSFIDHIVSLDEDILINSIILLAKELNLKVIAEGIEMEVQREYLKNKNCDIMQGYLFSKPITQDEVTNLIKTINEKTQKNDKYES